jgi:hypothetical protein
MSELLALFREWRAAVQRRLPPWSARAAAAALIIAGAVLPFLFSNASNFVNKEVVVLAYVVFALGLNIVVGFAGLLDLGYVAFFALGAYTLGWFGSDFFFKAHVHVLVSHYAGSLPGIHLNFLLILIAAAAGGLHRDRDAGVRRDHPGVRDQRHVDQGLRDAGHGRRARDQRDRCSL